MVDWAQFTNHLTLISLPVHPADSSLHPDNVTMSSYSNFVILALHILQSPLNLENVCRSVTPNPTGSSLYPDNVRHFIPPNSTNSTLYPGNVSRPFIPTPNSQLQFYVFALCFSSYISPPPPPTPPTYSYMPST